jgi:hypothetical protein
MEALFAGGRVVDAILAIVVLEAVALTLYWRRTGRGIPPGRLLPFLLAGAALLLALRGALTGAGPAWMGFWLLVAGLAHLWDLRGRWRS